MNGNLTKAEHLGKMVKKALKYNGIDQAKLGATVKAIIPAENAEAILVNCGNIDFFPEGAKAPASRAEVQSVIESMQKSLESLRKEVATHGERRLMSGSALFGQYNLKMKKLPQQSANLRKRIKAQLRAITWLMKSATDEATRESYYAIKSKAEKLAKETEKALKLIQTNYIVLATALVQCRKDM